MVNKTHATIHNVKGEQLPVAWAKLLGLDIEKDADLLVNVTLDVHQPTNRKKVSHKRIMERVKRLQAHVDPAKTLTDDDLYDEYGLPK